jgi:aminoglycoside phosphotransferase (APT) family kinase protein
MDPCDTMLRAFWTAERIRALAIFFARHVPAAGAIIGLDRLGKGRSNLTTLVRTSSRNWVVRSPPSPDVLPTAHDMAREYHFVASLHVTDVPVVPVVAFCDDLSVIGVSFYVAEYCTGVVIAGELPVEFDTPMRARAGAAAIGALARIHAVDWLMVGLQHYYRPESYVARQLRRLGKQWELSKTNDVPAMAELQARLASVVWRDCEPAIVHGDFGLHNIMLSSNDPGRVVAVLDWEMATIGDPLADLGWMLACWGEPSDPPARLAMLGEDLRVTSLPGFWSREQLMAEYERVKGSDMTQIGHYMALGLYKLAVIFQGIHSRHLAGVVSGQGIETFGERVPAAVDAALEAAGA